MANKTAAVTINIVELPEVVLEKIFSFLTYDNIAQNRIVCTRFNVIGGKMLNKGYYMADKYHAKTLKAIKAKLPRRESERRVHPLARQCDILIAIETRLSMLSMTFSKWMDAKLCCFIPGKVIDEIMRVLRCVAHNPSPPRAHEILQELRDISSMAMEHFDEKILPTLKVAMGAPTFLAGEDTPADLSMKGVSIFNRSETDHWWSGPEWLSKPNNIWPIINIEEVDDSNEDPSEGSSRVDDDLALVPVANKKLCVFPVHSPGSVVSVAEFNKLYIRESLNRRKLKAQGELISKQANEIADLRRHVEEWEAKLRDLTQNLNKAKDLPSTSTAIVPSRKRKAPEGKIIKEKLRKSQRIKK